MLKTDNAYYAAVLALGMEDVMEKKAINNELLMIRGIMSQVADSNEEQDFKDALKKGSELLAVGVQEVLEWCNSETEVKVRDES